MKALFERAFDCSVDIVALSICSIGMSLTLANALSRSYALCHGTALANIDKTFALLCPLLSCNAPFAYLKLQISQYQIECKQKHRGKRAIRFDSTQLDSTPFRLQLGGAIQLRRTSVEIRLRIDSEL